MTSARKIIPFTKKEIRRREDELAFLPAALEIVETPPSPTRRAVGAAIIALFCLALIWATFGTVDIVATAPGKIIPSGRTKLIQPFETGVVRAIHVRDGQTVKAGDVLIELDPTMTDAERDHLKSDLVAAELEVARLRAALGGRADPLEDFRPPEGASPSLIEMNRQFLISQTTEQQAKIAALDRQIAQKEAERDTIAVAIGKLEATIPILAERVEVRKLLYDKALGSKLTYLTEYQDIVGQRQDLLLQKSKVHEADAAIAALVQTRAQTAAEYRRTRFEELTKAEQKAAGFAQDVIKAEQRTKLQALTAPVDGVVQQLSVHTVGGVVTPAQALLVVVPLDSHLEIEAMVSNRDIGFVHADQEAEIKIDTFSFTTYGLLHGRVLDVSQDAITRQLNRFDEALASYDEAIALKPDYAEAFNNRGIALAAFNPRNTELQADLQSAVALHRRGQLVEAEQIYRSILRVAPGNFVATHLLGVSALQRGLLVEGEQLIAASA